MNKYQEALDYLVDELKGCDEAISDPESVSYTHLTLPTTERV